MTIPQGSLFTREETSFLQSLQAKSGTAGDELVVHRHQQPQQSDFYMFSDLSLPSMDASYSASLAGEIDPAGNIPRPHYLAAVNNDNDYPPPPPPVPSTGTSTSTSTNIYDDGGGLYCKKRSSYSFMQLEGNGASVPLTSQRGLKVPRVENDTLARMNTPAVDTGCGAFSGELEAQSNEQIQLNQNQWLTQLRCSQGEGPMVLPSLQSFIASSSEKERVLSATSTAPSIAEGVRTSINTADSALHAPVSILPLEQRVRPMKENGRKPSEAPPPPFPGAGSRTVYNPGRGGNNIARLYVQRIHSFS
jgi:hypothetical protein